MPALSNVALTDTFDTWRIRTNQVIIKGNEEEIRLTSAYDQSNTALNIVNGANSFISATIAGANTAVGAGANAYANLVWSRSNSFTSATIAGANTAVGAGANAFTSATIAGANTAVGTGANTYLLSVIAGANTAVGTGANTYLLSVIAGANTAVGAGANSFTSTTVAGASAAVGTGANSFTSATVAGANNISIAAFNKANTAVTSVTGTTNQIVVTGTTSVTLSTPQSIATSSSVQFESFGVGTAASGTSGEIRATNNITAYFSDMRLKEKIKTITNPIDRVMNLYGFFFINNDTAKKYGYMSNELQVGVSAQDVQSVLPEAVTAAPFDIGKDSEGNEYSISSENYLTVRYEKLIPLLIEAIKEQQKQIDELKTRVK